MSHPAPRCRVPAPRAGLTSLVLAGLCVALTGISTPAAADPVLSTTGPSPAIGALPVDASISSPPTGPYPKAPQNTGSCTFPAVTAPGDTLVKHVAPCAGSAGDGSAAHPWRTLAQAMAALQPGQVAYVHDGPNAVDYQESNLTPARGGTGAGSRITLMAAPGERPWVGKSPAVTTPVPILRLTQPWWVVDRLSVDATGQQFTSPVIRVGTGPGSAAHHTVLRRLSTRNAGIPNAIVAFDGATNSALLDSAGDTVGTRNLGLLEPLDADGRPATVPTTNDDHHAITVGNGADRILVRGNESSGHNGDSIQCGEEDSRSGPVTGNLTILGNRFHQDEENAVDLKACQGVTVAANKFYGYRPARPANPDGTPTSRAPQGDAIVAHAAASGRAADRLLIERNRLWDNSRAMGIGDEPDPGRPADPVRTVVVRRNLVFNSSTALCGIGAGIALAARTSEIYQNTLDQLHPQAQNVCGWGFSVRAALRLLPSSEGAAVQLWNNVISNTSLPYAASGTLTLNSRTNLLPPGTVTVPPNSLLADPMWVTDPASNDYYTKPGSPARDAATPLSPGVADPSVVCDDPSPSEPDTLAEPDIGFLESCSATAAVPVDLATYVADFLAQIPRAGQGGYVAPTASQFTALNQAASAVQAGRLADADTLLDPLGYDVVSLQDTVSGRTVAAMVERHSGTTWQHAWGMFLIDPNAAHEPVIEVPHPLFDNGTEAMGVDTFRKGKAGALLIAGAHRAATPDADVAHQGGSGFQAVHDALSTARRWVVQVHGFSATGHPSLGDAVVSSGATTGTIAVTAEAKALRKAGFSVCTYGATGCDGLGGTSNVEGAWTRGHGGQFVHLELNSTVRSDAARSAAVMTATAAGLVGRLALSIPMHIQDGTASFTVRNDGGRTFSVSHFVAGNRDAAGTNLDYPASAPVSVAPGTTYSYHGSRTLAAGNYTAWAAYFKPSAWTELGSHLSYSVG